MEEEREEGGREEVVGSDGNFFKIPKKILILKILQNIFQKYLKKHHEKTSIVKFFIYTITIKYFKNTPKIANPNGVIDENIFQVISYRIIIFLIPDCDINFQKLDSHGMRMKCGLRSYAMAQMLSPINIWASIKQMLTFSSQSEFSFAQHSFLNNTNSVSLLLPLKIDTTDCQS